MLNRRSSGLSRTTPLPRRTAPLARASGGCRAERGRQGVAYRIVDEAAEAGCLACGCAGPLDHSHCLTQKQWPAHRNNPVNIHLECRRCHEKWENNKHAYARQYPAAWAAKMAVMQQLEPSYYAFFRMKNPTLPK